MATDSGNPRVPGKRRTQVMGVLNVTPDSFSADGCENDPAASARRARLMVEEGADFIDVGGESTRPGSAPVEEAAEIERVVPVIEALGDLSVPISIDTSKPRVAEEAIRAGASMINDVAGAPTPMLEVAARHGVPVVAMHMRGTPRTMQEAPHYDDVVAEVAAYLAGRLEEARSLGVAMILDPGIGFGKTLEHNLALLRGLGRLAALGAPVLVGVSRKSFLGKITGLPVDQRVEATLAANVLAAAAGADIVRVHDVAANVRALAIADALLEEPSSTRGAVRVASSDHGERLQIEGLVLQSRVGVSASERGAPQSLVAAIDMQVAPSAPAGRDADSDAHALAGRLDYVELASLARECAVEREWRLLEALAGEIATRIKQRGVSSGVEVVSVRVRIVKSAVGQLVGARDVGVEVTL